MCAFFHLTIISCSLVGEVRNIRLRHLSIAKSYIQLAEFHGILITVHTHCSTKTLISIATNLLK